VDEFKKFRMTNSLERIPGKDGEIRVSLGSKGISADLLCNSDSVTIEFYEKMTKRDQKRFGDEQGWTFK